MQFPKSILKIYFDKILNECYLFWFPAGKMFRQILIFTALLVVKTMSERRQIIISVQTSFQRFQNCNQTLCECSNGNGNLPFSECNQACANTDCKVLTCSSGTCHQECHNCHMVCTREVGHCRQRCLSGVCSLTCNATRCDQQCIDGKCDSADDNTSPSDYKLIIPKAYLIALAVLLAVVAFLSALLLALYSCDGARYL